MFLSHSNRVYKTREFRVTKPSDCVYVCVWRGGGIFLRLVYVIFWFQHYMVEK